jgi:hypothetical protein
MKTAETDKEKELLDALESMVNQACGVSGSDTLDSMAISAYASAIRLLAKYGRVKIQTEAGRRVIAKWVK